MLLRTELEKSKIFIHFKIREDEWADLTTMQRGERPLEGVWTQETSVDSCLPSMREERTSWSIVSVVI